MSSLLLGSCGQSNSQLTDEQKEYASLYNENSVKVTNTLKAIPGDRAVGMVFTRLVSADEIKEAIDSREHHLIGFGYYSHTFGGYYSPAGPMPFEAGYAEFRNRLSSIADDVNNGSKQFFQSTQNRITRASLEQSPDLRASIASRLENIDLSKQFIADLEEDGNLIYGLVLSADRGVIEQVAARLPVDVYLGIKPKSRWSLARPNFVQALREQSGRALEAQSASTNTDKLINELENTFKKWDLDWRIR